MSVGPSRLHPAWQRVVGPPSLRWFSMSHGAAAAGDALVAVSLAGSLFFNVSPNASRQQVLLYLFITMAPFVLMAPLIGPAVDRFRGGRRLAGATAYALRALCCLGLAASLDELRFYFFALALLVVNKASGVVKHALVPKLVDDPSQLVATNAHLAKLGAVCGFIGGAIGVALLQVTQAPALLALAAVLFLSSTITMLRVPVGRTAHVPASVEYAELHLPSVVVASHGFMAIRACVGYFVFMLAFGLRRQSEPAWVYGLAGAAYGSASFLANVVAPGLRRRLHEERLMALALLGPAIACAFAVLGVGRPMMAATAFVIGFSATLGRQAFDSLLQHHAPDALRGRAFARFETRFQLTWVIGAVLATAVTLPTEISMGLLTATFLPAALLYLSSAREALRFEPLVIAADTAPVAAVARLGAAERWTLAGDHRLAVVDASSAVDLATAQHGVCPGPDVARRLAELRSRAVDAATEITSGDAEEALALARTVIDVL